MSHIAYELTPKAHAALTIPTQQGPTEPQCTSCGRTRTQTNGHRFCRGMCHSCYNRERYAGRLGAMRRYIRKDDPIDLDAFCEDYEWLRDSGVHVTMIAPRLGCTVSALVQRLYRAGYTERGERWYRDGTVQDPH